MNSNYFEESPLQSFLKKEGKSELYSLLKKNGEIWSAAPSFSPVLINEIHTNISFKHKFAKYLVNRALTEKYFPLPNYSEDARLESFINYYVWTAILNHELTEQQLSNLGFGNNDLKQGAWLKGNIITRNNSAYSPVKMSPGGGLYPVYRLFRINTMCFDANKFILGIRTESGPVHCQQYHKGCRPLDKECEDYIGRKWTLFQVDTSMSDDFTALFSNALDGDGSLEICDFINEVDVRVIFRCDY